MAEVGQTDRGGGGCRGHHRAWTWMITVLVTIVASVATALSRSVEG